MTRDQADMLIVWLADGLALVRTWIDAQVAPQSALQPIPGVLPKEPIAEPKRKRGRPRKARVTHYVGDDCHGGHETAKPQLWCEKCDPTIPGKVIPVTTAGLCAACNRLVVPPPALEDTASHEQAPKTYNCAYCGRVLPVAVRELHEANCRSAAVGYATHIAQPGKGGSDLG